MARGGSPRRRHPRVPFIIAGVVLNTIFLVREIRRNEQHDAFINAVTHELKTPVASIRLYLADLPDAPARRRQAARVLKVMRRDDSDRLLHTIEQVLRAGQGGTRLRHRQFARWTSHARVGLPQSGAHPPPPAGRGAHLPRVLRHRHAAADPGRPGRLAGGGLEPSLDNAISDSGPDVHVSVELDHTETSRQRSGARHRRRYLANGAQTHLRTLLRARDIVTTGGQGHRSRTVHRPIRDRPAWWEGIRRSAARARRRVHGGAARFQPVMNRILIVEDEHHLADDSVQPRSGRVQRRRCREQRGRRSFGIAGRPGGV